MANDCGALFPRHHFIEVQQHIRRDGAGREFGGVEFRIRRCRALSDKLLRGIRILLVAGQPGVTAGNEHGEFFSGRDAGSDGAEGP